jgi:WD40 repeat protein/serine/threonine protein kinase
MSWLDRLLKKAEGKGVAPGVGPHLLPANVVPKRTVQRPSGGTVLRGDAHPPGAPESMPAVHIPMLPTFSDGARIADAYKIKRRIGAGGMGTVYLAHHEQWNIDIVLKVPNPEVLADQEHRHRIAREAEVWTNLGLHPNIAYCYHVNPINEVPVMVVEYLDGGNLRDWVAEEKCADLKTGLDLAIQFCHAMEHSHSKGVVHRDIKPENVLLSHDGTLKLTDFGIARTVGGKEMNAGAAVPAVNGQTVGSIGTYEYMAPEQFEGAHNVDHRADIFAFGVCLYEMFCGQRPYKIAVGDPQDPPEPSQLRGNDTIPADLIELMKRCVHWERGHRPGNVSDIRRQICDIYERVVGSPNARAELPVLMALADHENNRAMSYLSLGKGEDADKAWEAALAADPNHVEAAFNYGLRLWRTARKTDQDILQRMQELCDLHREEWSPLYLLAQLHLERGDGESALRLVEAFRGEDVVNDELVTVRRIAHEMSSTRSGLVRSMEGHSGDMGSAYLSADGTVATSVDNRDLRQWDVTSGRCLRVFRLNVTSTDVAFADHQQMLLIEPTLTLREVATGKVIRTFADTGWSDSACVSNDKKIVISAGGTSNDNDGIVKIWDFATGQCLRTLTGHSGRVNCVHVSSDGRYAASGSNDKTVRLWEVQSGRCVHTFSHSTSVKAVHFSADGTRLLSGILFGLQLWDVATGCSVQAFTGHRSSVISACLTSDGRYAVSGSLDCTVRLWEVASGRCLRTFDGHKGWVIGVFMAEDPRVVLSASKDRTLKVWKVEPGLTYLATMKISGGLSLKRVLDGKKTFEANMQRAMTAIEAGSSTETFRYLIEARKQPGYRYHRDAVEMWGTLYQRFPRRRFAGASRQATIPDGGLSFSLSYDGRFVISSGNGMKLRALTSGELLRPFPGDTKSVQSLCFSRDGRFAASEGLDTVRVWDVETGRCLRTFDSPPAHCRQSHQGISFSADGRYLFSCGEGKSVRLWEVSTGRHLRSFEGHSAPIKCICTSMDGRILISGDENGTAKVWEVASRVCLHTIKNERAIKNGRGLSSGFSTVSFAIDGRRLLSGHRDGSMKLWDVESASCVRVFEGHTNEIQSLDWSVDGRLALTTGFCDRTKLWDVETGQCLHSFESAWCACLSSDCKFAFVSEAQGELQVYFLDWNLDDTLPSNSDEDITRHVSGFLRRHQPYAGELSPDHDPSDADVTRCLSRVGRPVWTDADFQGLLFTLACAGYGSLRPEDVRATLERMSLEYNDA